MVMNRCMYPKVGFNVGERGAGLQAMGSMLKYLSWYRQKV